MEWLWNLSDFFVFCIVSFLWTRRRTTFNHRVLCFWYFPQIKKSRINLFSHDLWAKNTGLCTVRELSTQTATSLFLYLKFAGFHNQSPLLRLCFYQRNLSMCAICTSAIIHVVCPKILHWYCLHFQLGRLKYPGEVKTKVMKSFCLGGGGRWGQTVAMSIMGGVIAFPKQSHSAIRHKAAPVPLSI